MSGNSQNKLRQVRKPRVHITLDVETEGSPNKELPFVLGVMGDFSGDPRKPREPDGSGRASGKKFFESEQVKELQPFGERSFVTIDRDNFNTVMKRMTPGLSLMVDDKLSDSGKQIAVDLAFTSLEDFEPARVAEQVPQLKALMETRAKLRDLMSKADRSRALEGLLEDILQNEDKRKSVAEGLPPDEGEE